MSRRIRDTVRPLAVAIAARLPPGIQQSLATVLCVLGEHWLWQTPSYRRWRRKRFAPKTAAGVTPIAPGDVEQVLQRLQFKAADVPVLTILIATYGGLRNTVDCLRSIAASPPSVAFEVLVVDDASGSEGIAALSDVSGLRFVTNNENLGYLRTVNAGSRLAKGQFLWLLNDDTIVTPGAADALLSAMQRIDKCAMAGSRLLNVDGSVQEAGGIVWNDGSANNFGAGTDRDDVSTRYLHDADYCSGASLMVRTAEFIAFGGYDETFAPAYYEETDLAFRVREAGRRVVVVPMSTVFHIAGTSYDASATRRLLGRNRERFVRKWRSVLDREHFPRRHGTFLARDHAALRKAILIVASATEVTQIEYLQNTLSDGSVVIKLWLVGTHDDNLVSRMGEGGIEVISANRDRRLDRWLWEHGQALDYVIVVGEHKQTTLTALERYWTGQLLRLESLASSLEALDLTPYKSLAARSRDRLAF